MRFSRAARTDGEGGVMASKTPSVRIRSLRGQVSVPIMLTAEDGVTKGSRCAQTKTDVRKRSEHIRHIADGIR
jgi:hypothetical protein